MKSPRTEAEDTSIHHALHPPVHQPQRGLQRLLRDPAGDISSEVTSRPGRDRRGALVEEEGKDDITGDVHDCAELVL